MQQRRVYARVEKQKLTKPKQFTLKHSIPQSAKARYNEVHERHTPGHKCPHKILPNSSPVTGGGGAGFQIWGGMGRIYPLLWQYSGFMSEAVEKPWEEDTSPGAIPKKLITVKLVEKPPTLFGGSCTVITVITLTLLIFSRALLVPSPQAISMILDLE